MSHSASRAVADLSEYDVLQVLKSSKPSESIQLQVITAIATRFPGYALDAMLRLPPLPPNAPGGVKDKLSLNVCDSINGVTRPQHLVSLAESCLSRSSPVDYALLDAVVGRSRVLLHAFSPPEFINLISVCAKAEFVDSDFAEAVQQWIPHTISKFSDNHLPIVFASFLRLGLDQPMDRLPPASSEASPPSPSVVECTAWMTCIISELTKRIPRINEAGCLSVLHAILRRPRSKTPPEMEALVKRISELDSLNDWSLAMRIQALHSLSRMGYTNQPALASLLRSVDAVSVKRVPSANLQHLLSIIHNHSASHPQSLWLPVVEVVVAQISEPHIVRSMSMSTIAITIGYLGRLGLKNKTVTDSLLRTFAGRKPTSPRSLSSSNATDEVSLKFVRRIISDPQVDISHLTSVLEALGRLDMWGLTHAVPLAMITRRLVFRDGTHNVKAAPLSLVTQCFLQNNFGLGETEVGELDSKIDRYIDEVLGSGEVSTNWNLKQTTKPAGSETGFGWQETTIRALIEGLLKHEAYIRVTPMAVARCVWIRDFLRSPETPVEWDTIPENIKTFLETIDVPPVDATG